MAPAPPAEADPALTGRTGAEALALARQHHPRILEHRWDHAGRAVAAKDPTYLSDHRAVVEHRGKKRLAVSSTALRARDRSGALRVIDGDLRMRGRQWVPENPLTDIRLPGSADGVVELPASNLAVRPLVGAASAPGRDASGKVFYGNAGGRAGRDVDMIVEPRPGGFETFYQLRRAEHHQLRLRVEGDDITLAPADGRIDVLRSGAQVASVSTAIAVDADGQHVPAATRVDGAEIVIDVAAAGHTAPIMVDPVVEEKYLWWDQGTGVDFGGWRWEKTDERFRGFDGNPANATNKYWGRGLYGYVLDPGSYGGGGWGEWRFDPKGDAYVESFHVYGLSQYYDHTGYSTTPTEDNRACTVLGIWSPAIWGMELKDVYSYVYGGRIWVGQQRERKWCSYRDHGREDFEGTAGTATKGHSGNYAIFQMSVPGQIAENFNTYMSGALLFNGDDILPNFTGGLPASDTTWRDRGTTSIYPTATDTGLGMKFIYFDGATSNGSINTTCLGIRHAECPANLPSGAGDTNKTDITFTPNEGAVTYRLRAQDIVGNERQHSWTLYTDRSDPTVTLSGSLRDRLGQPLTDSDLWRLDIDARDGDPNGAPAVRRSGVKRVQVWAGTVLLLDRTQTCATHSCPLRIPYVLDTDDLAEGRYALKVTVTDQLDHTTTVTPGDIVVPGPDHYDNELAAWTQTVTDRVRAAHPLGIATPLPSPPRDWASSAACRVSSATIGSCFDRVTAWYAQVGLWLATNAVSPAVAGTLPDVPTFHYGRELLARELTQATTGAFALARAEVKDPTARVTVKLSFHGPIAPQTLTGFAATAGMASTRAMRGYFTATLPITSGFHEGASPIALQGQIDHFFSEQIEQTHEAEDGLNHTLSQLTDTKSKAGVTASIADIQAYRALLQEREAVFAGAIASVPAGQFGAALRMPGSPVKAVEIVGAGDAYSPQYVRTDSEGVADLPALSPADHRLARARSGDGDGNSEDGGENDNLRARQYAPNTYNVRTYTTGFGEYPYHKNTYHGIIWEQEGTLSWYAGDDEHDRGYEAEGVVKNGGYIWSEDWQGQDKGNGRGTWESNLPDAYRDDLAFDGDYKQFAIGSANAKKLRYHAGYQSTYVTDRGYSERGEVVFRAQATRRATDGDEHGYCNGHGRRDSACFFANDTTIIKTRPLTDQREKYSFQWQNE